MSPVLETERLVLRPYTPDEGARVVALFTDPEVARYVGAGVQTEEEARRGFGRIFTHAYAPGGFDVWGVFAKADGAYVGHAAIKPRRDALARPGDQEIIYVLARQSWGRGFATELARRVVEYGFQELRLARICATVDPDNAASIHVLEKLGMRYEEEFTDETGWTLVYVVEA